MEKQRTPEQRRTNTDVVTRGHLRLSPVDRRPARGGEEVVVLVEGVLDSARHRARRCHGALDQGRVEVNHFLPNVGFHCKQRKPTVTPLDIRGGRGITAARKDPQLATAHHVGVRSQGLKEDMSLLTADKSLSRTEKCPPLCGGEGILRCW